MRDIRGMAIKDVDLELMINSVGLVAADCAEKANDENLSNQDRLKITRPILKQKSSSKV
jgi:putative ubiquitin-RnfH superfamily antitoxin RatB of RatAB toxin-antitoxin module